LLLISSGLPISGVTVLKGDFRDAKLIEALGGAKAMWFFPTSRRTCRAWQTSIRRAPRSWLTRRSICAEKP